MEYQVQVFVPQNTKLYLGGCVNDHDDLMGFTQKEAKVILSKPTTVTLEPSLRKNNIIVPHSYVESERALKALFKNETGCYTTITASLELTHWDVIHSLTNFKKIRMNCSLKSFIIGMAPCVDQSYRLAGFRERCGGKWRADLHASGGILSCFPYFDGWDVTLELSHNANWIAHTIRSFWLQENELYIKYV